MALKAVSERFCNALAFIVAGADPDRVDMTPAGNMVNSDWDRNTESRTSLRSEGVPQDPHRPLVILSKGRCENALYAPEVLEMRKRALVRLARPSIFIVPMKLVLRVLIALNW